MARRENPKDVLVTCPYDDTHRVKQSRFHAHVAKCEKNHLDDSKSSCRFNAQHKVEAGEMHHHMLECNDRSCIEKHLQDNISCKGYEGVPPCVSQPSESKENWNVDPSRATAYRPSTEPPKDGIRTDFSGMTASQRKKYYASLHSKNDAEAESGMEPVNNSNQPILREPKTKSFAQILEQPKPIHELQNIGLGRGQPLAPPTPNSRIAANIFGQQPVPIRQPRSAPHIPGLQIPTLGMGRGSANVNGVVNDDEPFIYTNDYESDGIEMIPNGYGRGNNRMAPR